MTQNVIFLKKLGDKKGDTRLGYMASVKEFGENANPKSFRVNANLPKLYPAMTLSLDFDEKGFVVNYDVFQNQKNITILRKNNVNVTEYFKDIEIHKKTKVLWREVEKIHEPYKNYDFETAELYAVVSGKKFDDLDRQNAIITEVIKYFRKSRKESYELSAFIDAFRKVEKRGKFDELYTLDAIMLIVTTDKRFKLEDCIVKDTELIEAHQYNRNNIQSRKRSSREFLPFDEIEKKLQEDKYCRLSDEQKRAILELSNSSPAVITGGAGTGKTSVIRGIIDILEEFGIKDYLLLAPTGRASQRMRETTSREAYTIHHALGIAEDNGYKRYDENNQLECSVIITDESSMIGDILMSDLLKASPDDAKLFFVGDKNQLYPVECGEPFCDFINDCLCHGVTLSQNFRQANDNGIGIYRNSQRVLDGEDIIEDTGVEIKHILEEEIPKYADTKPNLNTQNISPYNKVNDIINEVATADKKKNRDFYNFEKVVAIKNTTDYNNGDIGNITAVHDDGSLEVQFYQRKVKVPVEELCNIQPAYSLTVHKCQGSEFEKVNLFIPIKLNKFITKRLIYTAITRAKEHLTIYFYK